MQKIAAFVSLLFSSFSVGANVPISFHDIVVVEPSGDAVIRLKGYDLDGDNVSFFLNICYVSLFLFTHCIVSICMQLKYHITSPPGSGKLTQLSQVFSNYGYNPKAGTAITSSGATQVTGSKNRVYYKRSAPDAATNQLVSVSISISICTHLLHLACPSSTLFYH
jgi:hypothetical protein